MLNTDDRLLLSEALAPPPGHQPDLLVGTTYSLHLSALLSVPLAMTFADWERVDGAPSTDAVAALEAVRRHAEHITVFCQAGATAATDHPPLVASWLEDVVVPARAPHGGVFHPKVWVARYRPVDGRSPAYRMLCGSRNLTFDRSWDTVLVLDGSVTPRGGRAPATDPLADFVAALPSVATGPLTPARASAILQLAEELRRVRFAPPDGFHELAFCPLGIAGHRADPFWTRRTRMLVVAPFVGLGRLNAFDTEAQDSVLISRADELDGVATGALKGYSQLFALDEPEPPLEQSAGDERALTGLHAKLYIADAGWDSHVWTGSANATTAAFQDNVEFLVRLDGKRNDCGIEATLGKADDPLSLRAMLIEVPPRDEPGVPDPLIELERRLDGIAHDLAERGIVARISPQPAEGHFRVDLHATPAPELPADVAVRCWPLTS
ncbi:MAG: phospholipase D family protein, partial [Solirubrobacteraceae bacterium]